jgi:hypothetical protein
LISAYQRISITLDHNFIISSYHQNSRTAYQNIIISSNQHIPYLLIRYTARLPGGRQAPKTNGIIEAAQPVQLSTMADDASNAECLHKDGLLEKHTLQANKDKCCIAKLEARVATLEASFKVMLEAFEASRESKKRAAPPEIVCPARKSKPSAALPKTAARRSDAARLSASVPEKAVRAPEWVQRAYRLSASVPEKAACSPRNAARRYDAARLSAAVAEKAARASEWYERAYRLSASTNRKSTADADDESGSSSSCGVEEDDSDTQSDDDEPEEDGESQQTSLNLEWVPRAYRLSASVPEKAARASEWYERAYRLKQTGSRPA